MATEELCRADVLREVAMEVLDSGQRVGVFSDLDCGSIEIAASKVRDGLCISIMAHDISPARADTLCARLGIESSIVEQAQGLMWS